MQRYFSIDWCTNYYLKKKQTDATNAICALFHWRNILKNPQGTNYNYNWNWIKNSFIIEWISEWFFFCYQSHKMLRSTSIITIWNWSYCSQNKTNKKVKPNICRYFFLVPKIFFQQETRKKKQPSSFTAY